LLAAFVAVAVGAVALVAVTAAVSVDRRTSALIAEQQAQLEKQVAAALAAAYTAGKGSWRPQDLATLQTLALTQGTRVVVWDHSGHQVATMGSDDHDSWQDPTTLPAPHPSMTDRSTPSPSGHDWDDSSQSRGTGSHDDRGMSATDTGIRVGAVRAVLVATSSATIQSDDSQPVVVPIVVDGTTVGTAHLTLPAGARSSVEAARDSLLRTLAIGAALAVLLAVVAAAVVSGRISRPLVALAAATRSFAAGEPHPERLLRTAPGELGELGRAFRDMTGRLAEQETARRALVADVAHELRTPVTIRRGQTEQLLDGIADPTTERLVSLHDEVLRLERVTEDLATLSTADAAGLALDPEPVELGKLTLQIVEAMQPHFDDADLSVRTEIASEVIVSADPARLSQVVTNLLTNATKFTPPGGVNHGRGASVAPAGGAARRGHRPRDPRRRASPHLRPVLARPGRQRPPRHRDRAGRGPVAYPGTQRHRQRQVPHGRRHGVHRALARTRDGARRRPRASRSPERVNQGRCAECRPACSSSRTNGRSAPCCAPTSSTTAWLC
jgi:two-component system sensor histidine kinase BaeS